MDPSAAIDRVRRIREQKEAWDSAAENALLWESVPAAHQATSEGAPFVWEPVVASAQAPRLFPADLEGWEKERRPWDTRQGCFPDCFFCAAVGTLPARTVRRLFLTDESEAGAAGVYAVRLWRGDAWVGVLVDDVVPKTPENKRLAYFASAKQASSSGDGGLPLLWPSLLEKAYAAFYGGFARIVGGSVPEALHDLLGDSAAVLRDRRMLLDGYLPRSLRQKKGGQVVTDAFDLCIAAGTPPAGAGAAPAASAGKKKEVHGFLTPNHAYVVVPHVTEEPGGGRRGKKGAAAVQVVFELVNPQLDKAARCNGAATLPGSSVPASFVAQAEAARPAGLPAGKYVSRAELEALMDGFFFSPLFRSGDGAADALRPAGVFSAPLSASLGTAGGGPSYCTFRDNPLFRVAVEGRGGGGGGARPAGGPPPLGRYFVTVSQEERRGAGSVGARLSYPLLGVTVASADAGKQKAAGAPSSPPALAAGLLVPGRYTRELVSLPPVDPFPLSFYNTRTASYDVTPCLAAAEAAGRGSAVFVVPSTPDPGADVPSLRVAFHSAPDAPPLRVEPLTEALAALRGCAVQVKSAFDAAASASAFHKATQYSVGFADVEAPLPPAASIAVTAVLRQASAPRKGGVSGGGDTVGAQPVALLAFSGVAGAGEGGGAGRVAEDGENATCLTPLPPKLSKQAEVAVELRGLKPSAFPLVLVPVVHSGAGAAPKADAGYTLSVYCTDAPLTVRKATGAARRPSSGRRLPPSAGASKPKPKVKPNPKGKGTSMSLPVMQKASSSTGGLAGLYSGL